ncbi:MAG: phosphatidylserine decarboxylase, partial [Pirellulaceae bacterium]|nr:phosphatidylserine decarboxylase [Pirellulaceae bacterium]
MAIGLLFVVTLLYIQWWPSAIVAATVTVLVLSFFRDPYRSIPSDRNILVSPADGRVTSVHELDHFEPFGGPALCIRIFLSVLNVHVNRSPCHGVVNSIERQAGDHLSALNPKAADQNEWSLMVLRHPTRGTPIAAVRQIAGRLARTIICRVHKDQILQRGERFGMIVLGSTAELYIPACLQPRPNVIKGQKVAGGTTILARIVMGHDRPRDKQDTRARVEKREATVAKAHQNGPSANSRFQLR